MGNWGIKVSAPGYGIETTDIRNIIMSSKFPMLKYYDDLSSSVTFAPGDSHQYHDFAHSLGYVPAYLAFYKWDGKTYNINAGAATGVGGGVYSYSWASSSIIRVGMVFTGQAYGRNTFYQTMVDCYDDRSSSRIGYRVGRDDGNLLKGAVLFNNVTIPKNATIVSAVLSNVVGSREGSNTDIKYDVYGIDEDNTNDFGSNNPFERTKTTATRYIQGNINNSRFDADVKSIVEEITTRSGWSSGNRMGFTMTPTDSSPDNVNFEDDINSGSDSYLTVVYNTTSTSMVMGMRTIIFKDKISA